MKKIFPAIMLSALIWLPASVHGNEGYRNTQEYQFSAKIDSIQEGVSIEMGLTNNSSKKLTFEFPTSQMYEILIRDRKGKVVYTYSKGRSFLQSIQELELNPGEEKIWSEKWMYGKDDGKNIESGDYLFEISLLPKKMNGVTVNKQNLKTEKLVKVDLVQKTFRNVKASGGKGNYVVKGEVWSSTGRFFYTVEDGHNEFLAGKKLTKNKSGQWESFKIIVNVPKNHLPKNGTLMLSLFDDGEFGSPSHGDNSVILETFRQRDEDELKNH